MTHELTEICTRVHLVQQGSITLHGIMETGHPVHVDVVLPRRDGGQVHKHLEFIDVLRGAEGRSAHGHAEFGAVILSEAIIGHTKLMSWFDPLPVFAKNVKISSID